MGIGRATVIALISAAIVSITTLGVGRSRADIVIDPEVDALVLAGRVRVLVARTLETLTDIVTSVQLDRTLKPQ